MAAAKKPTISAPSPEELTKFIAQNNLTKIPTPPAQPGLQIPGVTPTSSNPGNVVPKVDGNTGLENMGTSNTSPLLPSAGPGTETPVAPFRPTVGPFAGAPQPPALVRDIEPDPARARKALGQEAPTPPGAIPTVPAGETGLEVDSVSELVNALAGGDLEELLRLGSAVTAAPVFQTLELIPETNQFQPRLIVQRDSEGKPTGAVPATPSEAELALAAQFTQIAQLRAIALSQAQRGAEIEAQIAGTVAAEQELSIGLPEEARAAGILGEVGTSLQGAFKEIEGIMALPAGPDQAAAAQAFLFKEVVPLPSEVRWDDVSDNFVNAPGFQGRQRSEETIKYLAEVKPYFEARASMKVVVDLQVEAAAKHAFNQAEIQASDTRFREHMASGAIDSAEEQLARLQQAQTQDIADNQRIEDANLLASFLGNPTLMALARHYGVLPQFESVLGISIPFGKNMNLPPTGEIPGPEQFLGMSGYEKLIAREDWKASTGGTDDDFNLAFVSQLPGAPVQGTRVSVI